MQRLWWLCIAWCVSVAGSQWRCPALGARPAAECSCDLPRTLRCAGDHTALQKIGRHLREQKTRNKNSAITLLDCSLGGVTILSSSGVSELAGAGLHGLVISSGEIRRVQATAFADVADTLQALGLPNNQLPSVPTEAVTRLWNLDRLDLSNNKIHTLDSNSFKGIKNLTYLDISDNQLTDIATESFRPLERLTTLRLRGNLLKVPALASLKEAHMLRDLDLSGNALEGPVGPTTVPSLSYLISLQLADNTFASIRRGALSGLTNLTHLNLHNNQIDVIEEYAFKHLSNLTSSKACLTKTDLVLYDCSANTVLIGLTNLTHLNLHNNQIDVLEDYAFKHLSNLTHLDLSHNEIVAVSGASLAQLTSLALLDLSHNFLRSLSAEPLKSLSQLSSLLLHDNDISMIDDGALAMHKDLTRFTIEDNPLNCDCLMGSFARWLREAENLSQADKAAAVCATPPHLEGALISRLSKNKLCDELEPLGPTNSDAQPKMDYDSVNAVDRAENYDGLDDDIYDEEMDVPGEDDLPISKGKVRLIDAFYDDEEVYLSWSVDPPSTHRHRCTGVTVSRAGGLPKHVACHRAAPGNVIVRGLKIDALDQYTFCIALEEMDMEDNPQALVLGCGNPQTVRKRAAFATAVPVVITRQPELERPDPLRVSEVRSNVTTDGVLTVLISVMGLPQRPLYVVPRSQRLSTDRYPIPNCYVVLAVLSRGSLVAQKDTPCQNNLEISMEGFLRPPYEVCAKLSKFKEKDMRPICIVPQLLESGSLEMKAGFRNLNAALIGVALGLMVIIVGLVWVVRKMFKKPVEFEPHRCFRPEPVPEETPRASYVMLTATSKV